MVYTPLPSSDSIRFALVVVLKGIRKATKKEMEESDGGMDTTAEVLSHGLDNYHSHNQLNSNSF